MTIRITFISIHRNRFTLQNATEIWPDINKLTNTLRNWQVIRQAPVRVNLISQINPEKPGYFTITIEGLSGNAQLLHQAMNNIMQFIGLRSHYYISEIEIGGKLGPSTIDSETIYPIYQAAKDNNLAQMKEYIKENYYLNGLPNMQSLSLLALASQEGHIEMVKLLLENHANPNLPCGPKRETPIYYAIRTGKSEIARILLLSRANVMVRNKNDHSPLDIAIKSYGSSPNNKNEKLIKLLLDYGAAVGANLSSVSSDILNNKFVIGAKKLPENCIGAITNSTTFFDKIEKTEFTYWLKMLRRFLAADVLDELTTTVIQKFLSQLEPVSSLNEVVSQYIAKSLIKNNTLFYRGEPVKLMAIDSPNAIELNFKAKQENFLLPQNLANQILQDLDLQTSLPPKSILEIRDSFYQQAKTFYKLGDYVNACIYFQYTLDYTLRYHKGQLDKKELALSYHNLGRAYQKCEQYEAAIYSFENAKSVYYNACLKDATLGVKITQEQKYIDEVKSINLEKSFSSGGFEALVDSAFKGLINNQLNEYNNVIKRLQDQPDQGNLLFKRLNCRGLLCPSEYQSRPKY